MLAALWRESPFIRPEPGSAMVSLLHVDSEGCSFVGALIAESGLAPKMWPRRYLEAYLVPLLHCFYAHDPVFMPHGENLIMVLDRGVPGRVLMNDIGEEVAAMNPEADLPPGVDRIRQDVPEDLKALAIFTDIFDCFFRFLNGILCTEGLLSEDQFSDAVAECVQEYQRWVPHLRERFERYDLFAESFTLSCLNRLQLRNTQEMVDLQDPAGALQTVGRLENPIARRVPVLAG
jgi:siderophore synthetase component